MAETIVLLLQHLMQNAAVMAVGWKLCSVWNDDASSGSHSDDFKFIRRRLRRAYRVYQIPRLRDLA